MVDLKVADRETTKDDLVEGRRFRIDNLVDGGYSDCGRLVERISVNAGADGWECHASEVVLPGDLQRLSIAGREKFDFAFVAAVPYWPYGVDNTARRQIVPLGKLCVSGFAAAQGATLLQQAGTGRAVNGTIDTSASEQGGVGRIDDRIDLQRGDVGLNGLQRCHSARIFPFRIAEIRQGIQRFFSVCPFATLPLIINVLRNSDYHE